MPFDSVLAADARASVERDVFAAADQFVRGTLAELSAGLSPFAAMRAWQDWFAYLTIAPGRQAMLWHEAAEAAMQVADFAGRAALAGGRSPTPTTDRRFAAAEWQAWPFNVLHQSYLAAERWWHGAIAPIPGRSGEDQRQLKLLVEQQLHALSPANFMLTNPAIQRRTLETGGCNLLTGMGHLAADTFNRAAGAQAGDSDFAVGRNIAITPGKVVFRNRLIELIQYEPQTPTVFEEPVLIVPAWIMKYYILDLQPRNSLIKYLVEQGHTVFVVSWKNPEAEDRALNMDDYRRDGVMAAIAAIEDRLPGRRIHACGYCLGGTMLSIAAAAMARDHDERLATMTLFAAQTDFTEPGELKVFINEATLTALDALMERRGYLDGAAMGAGFQMLRADDLIWAPFVKRYLLGETDHPNDLMAWNADQTRMPYRMHSEYLRKLFLHNELAQGRFVAGGKPVALCDVSLPIFALGTAKDHVAPWRSVFKIHLSTRSDVTFALASGGHNAGVVSEPGHPRRSYQILRKQSDGNYVDPDRWLTLAARNEGSWWPAWQSWLARHSTEKVTPPQLNGALADAPGTYVMAR